MRHFIAVRGPILTIAILSSLTLTNCGTSRNIISFEQVKDGQHLDKAIEITVSQFFQIWMSNRYPQKIDLNCHELYKSDIYTYFGESTLKGLSIEQNLYKVRNDSLNIQFPNYQNIDGELVRQEFWEKVIPGSDKDIRKNADCLSSSSIPRFAYELDDETIKITLEWKFKCDGRTLIDKTYYGYYDMKELEIIE